MKVFPGIAALAAAIVCVLVLRIVLHGYTGHGHLDVFHLVVGIASALVALLLARQALLRRA